MEAKSIFIIAGILLIFFLFNSGRLSFLEPQAIVTTSQPFTENFNTPWTAGSCTSFVDITTFEFCVLPTTGIPSLFNVVGSDGKSGLRITDWDTWVSSQGVWFVFDPRNYNDYQLNINIASQGLDTVPPDACMVWAVNNTGAVSVIINCGVTASNTDGLCGPGTDSVPEAGDYMAFQKNLAAIPGLNLDSPTLEIHIGGAANGAGSDFCIFDDFSLIPLAIACSNNDICPIDNYCSGGTCVLGCDNTIDCSNGLVCSSTSHGQCIPCTSSSQCLQNDYYCSAGACILGCDADLDCAGGQVCSSPSHGQCIPASGTSGCASQSNPNGYCDAIQTGLTCDLANDVCVPSSSFVCTQGTYNPSLNLCQINPPPCTTNSQCGVNGYCFNGLCQICPIGIFNPVTQKCEYAVQQFAGYCPLIDTILQSTVPCTTNSQCSPLAANSICLQGVCVSQI